LEIGDIIVINKMDKPGAEDAGRQINHYFGGRDREGWHVPILLARADKGHGINELVQAIKAHSRFLMENKKGKEQEREKITAFMSLLLKEELWKRFVEAESGSVQFQRMIDEVRAGKEDPYTAVDRLMKSVLFFEERKAAKNQRKAKTERSTKSQSPK